MVRIASVYELGQFRAVWNTSPSSELNNLAMRFTIRSQTPQSSNDGSAKSTDSKKKDLIKFLSLPPEIRIIVYEELSASRRHTLVRIGIGYAYIKTWAVPLAILRTCRLVNTEAYPVLKPRLYAIMVLPPEIYIDTAQLYGVSHATSDLRHFLHVLHRTSRNRGTTITIRDEKVAISMSKSHIMRWSRRRTPEMLWLRSALQVPTQGKYLIAFFQQAELFLRGGYAWSLPTWGRLLELHPPQLLPMAGLQIHVQDRNFGGIITGMNAYGMILFGMFLNKFESFTGSTNGFETSIRGYGPIVHIKASVEEGGQDTGERRRYMTRVIYQHGLSMRHSSEILKKSNDQD